jgi:PAS domain S-box-containing protein
MDTAGVLVHVSSPVRAALGYRADADLVGRPLLVLVPERFRQAHLAGTALHVTGGRDVIFRHPVTVPMLAADGTEVRTRLRVHRDRLPQGAEVYVGDLEFLAG